jgi:hypothetical protein
MSKRLLIATAFVCGAIATAMPAAASTVMVSQQGGNAFVDAGGQNGWSQTTNTNFGNFGAGLFRLKADDGSGPINFLAFCVDLVQNLNLPGTYERKDDLFTGTVRQNIDALLSNAFLSTPTLVVNAQTAAAFQIALWEIISDTTFDLAAGNFRMSNNPSGRGLAVTWLANITNGTWKPTGATFTFLHSGTLQDVLAIGIGGPTPVPLPAGLWLMGAGVAGLIAMRRRAA